MRSYGYFIAVLAVISIIIIGAIFVIKPTAPINTSGTASQKIIMSNYASNNSSEVSFTQDGITNADELHRSIKITVNNHLTNLTVFSGYQGRILKSQTIANNVDSYREFLASLQKSGFDNQRKIDSSITLIGQCPLGYKYVLGASGFLNTPKTLWTTSCSSVKGTFAGKITIIEQLFHNQLPNYNDFVADVELQ